MSSPINQTNKRPAISPESVHILNQNSIDHLSLSPSKRHKIENLENDSESSKSTLNTDLLFPSHNATFPPPIAPPIISSNFNSDIEIKNDEIIDFENNVDDPYNPQLYPQKPALSYSDIINSSKPKLRSVSNENERNSIQQDARKLGLDNFLIKYIVQKNYSVISLLNIFEQKLFFNVDDHVDTEFLPLLKISVKKFIQKRPKIPQINSIEDALFLMRRAKRIIVLTGAGVSVSCGIPDFRSSKGIYQQLANEFGLDDPQQMFDIDYFMENPELFYSFAKQLYPDNFKPSPSHYFIKLLEDRAKLLRNYTQNIDTLEHVTGINKVLNCHGSFATATCVRCGYKCQGDDIKKDVMNLNVSYCPRCNDPKYTHNFSQNLHSLSEASNSLSKPHEKNIISTPSKSFSNKQSGPSTPPKISASTHDDLPLYNSNTNEHSGTPSPSTNTSPHHIHSPSKSSKPAKNRNRTVHINKHYSDSDSDASHDSDYKYDSIQGVMKPDIVFFGENLPSIFHSSLQDDRTQVDLLIVMGSSLKVAPVSEIMGHLPPNIPQIVINKTPITHLNFDIQLIGDSDDIVAYLCYRLGWNLCHPRILGGSSLSDEYIQNLSHPFSKSGNSELDKSNYFNLVELWKSSSEPPFSNSTKVPVPADITTNTSNSAVETSPLNKNLAIEKNTSNSNHQNTVALPSTEPHYPNSDDIPSEGSFESENSDYNSESGSDQSDDHDDSSHDESNNPSSNIDCIPKNNTINDFEFKEDKAKTGKASQSTLDINDDSNSDDEYPSDDSYTPIIPENNPKKPANTNPNFQTRRNNNANIYNLIPQNWHLFKGFMMTAEDIYDYYNNSGLSPSLSFIQSTLSNTNDLGYAPPKQLNRKSESTKTPTGNLNTTPLNYSTNTQPNGITSSSSNSNYITNNVNTTSINHKSKNIVNSSIPNSYQLSQDDISQVFQLDYSTDSSQDQ
ncbi:NAD-dependent histone deacetylase sir2 [Smittium culicis]|uniref:NAD-dependent histone deacetylase sir2 n=1 Tax=Smittium culicis TaxID=133412 RepID=A0A1R1YJH7_9FUNG|nr:NAD-dependent histone deacetylase sir2 [Smittium culicis]